MHPLLRSIEGPEDFKDWSLEKLDELADEIRDVCLLYTSDAADE